MGGTMQELNSDTFAKETKKGNVIIDFWAPWCGPCKLMGPVFESASKENQDVKFFKVNVDDSPDLASDHGVMSIPTIIFMKDGEILDHMIGFASKPAFSQKIKQAFS